MTYATYFLWVGVSRKQLEEAEGFDLDELLPDAKQEKVPDVASHILCEHVFMHGETVGYGSIVHEFDWVTSDEEPESPHLELWTTEANERRDALESLFRNRGLPLEIEVKIFHHIDLGG